MKCSVCGEPWAKHTERDKVPTLETCIKVLQATLTAARSQRWMNTSATTGSSGIYYNYQ